MTNSDRMPPIAAEAMTPEQRVAASEIAAGPRGELSGPFVPALRSPEFMRRLQRLGEYLRYDAALPPALREMVILLTAQSHKQSYEWSVHEPIARREGLSPSIIAALETGRRPDGMTPDETLIFEFFAELQTTHDVSDATYGQAIERFGEQGVIDLIGLVGYYGTLALIMNATRVRG
jgi:4-carboxymuconolactone decarboxylase